MSSGTTLTVTGCVYCLLCSECSVFSEILISTADCLLILWFMSSFRRENIKGYNSKQCLSMALCSLTLPFLTWSSVRRSLVLLTSWAWELPVQSVEMIVQDLSFTSGGKFVSTVGVARLNIMWGRRRIMDSALLERYLIGRETSFKCCAQLITIYKTLANKSGRMQIHLWGCIWGTCWDCSYWRGCAWLGPTWCTQQPCQQIPEVPAWGPCLPAG